jgi:DNA-binding NarL/FixJ family response regulator
VITVAVADDQALVRAGFRALLEAEPEMQVVGEAVDGEGVLALVRQTHPDVVLMDIRMPGVDGLEATRRIAADPDLESTRVLVLTTFELDEYVFEALRVGASGFLVKDTEPADLVQAVRVVARGDALLSPRATRSLIARFLAQPREAAGDVVPAQLAALTDREREVVAQVALGLSNQDIAGRLFLSPLTVKTHVNRAMAKLDVRDRAQLVVLAYQTGLVRAGDPAS